MKKDLCWAIEDYTNHHVVNESVTKWLLENLDSLLESLGDNGISETLRAELYKIEDENESLKDDKKSLLDERNTLETEVRNLQGEIRLLEDKCDELQSELDSLKETTK